VPKIKIFKISILNGKHLFKLFAFVPLFRSISNTRAASCYSINPHFSPDRRPFPILG
jgi:hypothetical protein